MKNRIIFFEARLWEKFIHSLLYPAILGSLIYDFTKFEFENKFYLLLITVFFYVIDDLYMTYKLDSFSAVAENGNRKKKSLMIVLDLLVAFLFMAIIYSIHNSLYNYILIFTILVYISALFYFPNTKISDNLFRSLVLVSLLILFFQFIIEKYYSCNIMTLTNWTYPTMVALYLIVIAIDYYLNNSTN